MDGGCRGDGCGLFAVQDGLQAWGDLYDSLVARLRPVVEGEPMGLAQADNLLSHPDRARRASAWHGIQAAWQAEQETVAAILNAINGWRQELEDQRGKSRRLDALDLSCHQGTWIAPPWRP